MLYNLLFPLSDSVGIFNIFQYLTFRAGAAIVTAFLVSFLIGPMLIRTLRARQGGGQPIREDGPESHLKTKQGTPTMGGFLILLGVLAGTLLWADLTNSYVWVILFVTVGFGAGGFIDDFVKLRSRSSRGFPTKIKFLVEIALAVAAGSRAPGMGRVPALLRPGLSASAPALRHPVPQSSLCGAR